MKGDKYSFIALSINFLVTRSYIFENAVKILTNRKFDRSLFLEVTLSSDKTMTMLALPGKCLLINYYLLHLTKVVTKHCYRFYKFRRNHIKTNSFFCVKYT